MCGTVGGNKSRAFFAARSAEREFSLESRMARARSFDRVDAEEVFIWKGDAEKKMKEAIGNINARMMEFMH